MIACEFCGKEVAPARPGSLRHVSGWERIRSKTDGVHPLKLREISGRYAHSVCVDIAQHGGTQQELLSK